VQDALKHLYRPGVLYRGCGVIASDISNRESWTFDLFGQVEANESQGKILEMVDLINRKYGRDTMTMAAGLIAKAKARASRFAYPMIEVS
jgi:DNA polymerase V